MGKEPTANTETSNEQPRPKAEIPEALVAESPDSSVRRGKPHRAAIVVVGVILVAAAIAAVTPYAYERFRATQVTPHSTVANDGNLTTTSTEESITNVVDKAAPSVVSIITSSAKQTVFGTSQQQEAAGTGIIVSKDGYVLTNNHVIDGATKATVVTSDGTTYDDVKVIGSDPLNDIAYLKISGVTSLTPAELGDSSTTRVGQQVVAIGNALGQYQNTVSSGIVSGKGRPLTAQGESADSTESLSDLLQTDAAINPGNSGGPLLNLSGQVIGINTAVATDAQGIGFSIPINAAKGTLKSVLAGKGVKRAYLGLRYVEITPTVAKQYELAVKRGAYVFGDGSNQAIISGSPAAKAGLKEKDIITSINAEKIGVSGGVSTLIGEYAPGDTVALVVLRDGKEHTINVTLAEYTSSN